jgi:transposase-like protein
MGSGTSPEVAAATGKDQPVPAPHPPEFRRRAIELARQGDQPVAAVAKQLSVSEPCLRNWIAHADDGATDSRLSAPAAPGLRRPIEGTAGRHRDVQGTITDNPVLIMVLRLAQVSRGPPRVCSMCWSRKVETAISSVRSRSRSRSRASKGIR